MSMVKADEDIGLPDGIRMIIADEDIGLPYPMGTSDFQLKKGELKLAQLTINH